MTRRVYAASTSWGTTGCRQPGSRRFPCRRQPLAPEKTPTAVRARCRVASGEIDTERGHDRRLGDRATAREGGFGNGGGVGRFTEGGLTARSVVELVAEPACSFRSPPKVTASSMTDDSLVRRTAACVGQRRNSELHSVA
jgi:hypothetical protein